MKCLLSFCFIFLPLMAQEKVSLIQDHSTLGWKSMNGGSWNVEQGTLSGKKEARIDKHCLLISEKSFRDFELSMDYKAMVGNSGFYFRLLPEKNGLGFKGYHAEIDSEGKNAGGLYDVAVAWIHKPNQNQVDRVFRKGDWNHMKIIAKGPHIQIFVNGLLTTDLKAERSFEGQLGIQLHANEGTQIQFKNMEITEFK